MREPIEGSSGQPFAAQHFCPILEGQIGCDNETLTLVGGANDVEQQFSTDLAGWNEPKLMVVSVKLGSVRQVAHFDFG